MATRAMRLAVMLVLVGLVSAPVGAAASPTRSQPSSSTHKLSWQDRPFMRQAARAGLFEVKKSELALARSRDRQVRQLAAQMIRDHTKANQELKQLTAAKGVILPRRPSAHQRMIIRRLARQYGNHFNCAYMAVQVHAHSKRSPSSDARWATAATRRSRPMPPRPCPCSGCTCGWRGTPCTSWTAADLTGKRQPG